MFVYETAEERLRGEIKCEMGMLSAEMGSCGRG